MKGFEKQEITYAKDQPQYGNLPSLRSHDHKRIVLSRWALSDVDREAIALGADVYLFCWTFGQKLQPVSIQIGACGADLSNFANTLGLLPDGIERK